MSFLCSLEITTDETNHAGGELYEVGLPATKDPAHLSVPPYSPPLRYDCTLRIKKPLARHVRLCSYSGDQSRHRILPVPNNYGAAVRESKYTKSLK